jgi:hypothetical protein
LVATTKVYSGLGAGVVMESIALVDRVLSEIADYNSYATAPEVWLPTLAGITIRQREHTRQADDWGADKIGISPRRLDSAYVWIHRLLAGKHQVFSCTK